MKNIFVYIGIGLIILLLFLPLISIGNSENKQNISKKEQSPIKEESLKVLISETEQINEISVTDYIFGVVAGEMPASYSEEALKAQAVAAYTYLLRRKVENEEKEYDITDSPLTDQHYISESEAREKWGENAEEYVAKIKNAVLAVEGKYIAFGGEPILALYHACSGGKTEEAKDVFGEELPYLVSVDSLGDLLEKDYATQKKFTTEEFYNLMKEKADLSGELNTWVGETKYRPNGYVEGLVIGGKIFSGAEIRNIFSLRSANFDIKFDDGFIFSVRGYGHGVGMSQSGAEYMAKQGGTYEEILFWYYKNCEILKKN